MQSWILGEGHMMQNILAWTWPMSKLCFMHSYTSDFWHRLCLQSKIACVDNLTKTLVWETLQKLVTYSCYMALPCHVCIISCAEQTSTIIGPSNRLPHPKHTPMVQIVSLCPPNVGRYTGSNGKPVWITHTVWFVFKLIYNWLCNTLEENS